MSMLRVEDRIASRGREAQVGGAGSSQPLVFRRNHTHRSCIRPQKWRCCCIRCSGQMRYIVSLWNMADPAEMHTRPIYPAIWPCVLPLFGHPQAKGSISSKIPRAAISRSSCHLGATSCNPIGEPFAALAESTMSILRFGVTHKLNTGAFRAHSSLRGSPLRLLRPQTDQWGRPLRASRGGSTCWYKTSTLSFPVVEPEPVRSDRGSRRD